MPENNIYKEIAERCGGNVYIGVVGPVRTGKSTFIQKFMEAMVLPNMEAGSARERARDELPQAAAGRTVMTATTTDSETTLNVSHLPNGTYIVRIGSRVAKIVKN